ncbi:hypothetical protein [Bacillus sp. V2I10]|uniref:hypothetical protein n=1 Tax=Bacillus sp. V2I10 TaxID=3042276 RepID=UPI0027893A88|nr:hypothetical protein [Bacillus sp. V2I10]MDQ0861603.1 hypothetical protein [Bacillus sp. V2I10]
MKAYNREYPTTTDSCLDIMSSAKNGKYTQKEALKILLTTPELLDPLQFLLFSYDTNLQDAVSYKDYVALMKNKAMKTKNQALLNIVKELDGDKFD